MGVRTVCPDGYVVRACRCRDEHDVKVVPCPKGHNHHTKQWRKDEICPRCGEQFSVAPGLVCSWCAEQLIGTVSVEVSP